MLYIRFDKPINQAQTKQSAFVSFKYDPYYVQAIKELPCRYWIPESKEWEVPTNLLERVKDIDIVQFLNDPEKAPEAIKIDHSLFKTKPLKHQIEGVEHGLEMNCWLLGDQQGLGKTKQIIDLAIQKKYQEGLKHCLIICGINNLKYNWAEEIEKHSNEDYCILGKRFVKPRYEPSMKDRLTDIASCPKEFFWITNIETLRMHKEGRFYKSEIVEFINAHIANGDLSLIVVDEAHKAKNPTSAQGRGLLRLKGCPKIGLSGTFLVNKPLDLYMPLTFIEALHMSYFQFVNRYTVKDGWGHPVGYKNMNELKQLMDQYMLRRTKALLDLPEKIHVEEYIEMSKDERKLYEEIVTATKQECDKIANPANILSKLIRMRQVCCHTGLVSTKIVQSSKFNRLKDILDEAKENNEKVLVFSMFRELVALALDEFKEYNPLYIWGGMSQIELENQKNHFQQDEGFQVLFGVIQAAGTGITLNEASTVVFLDLPWNRATMEQAEDRAHRIGTKKTVTVISLLMKDSYDEALHKMIISKQAMGEILIDGKDPKQFRKFLNVIFREKGEDDYE